jgi:hypothetical protein
MINRASARCDNVIFDIIDAQRSGGGPGIRKTTGEYEFHCPIDGPQHHRVSVDL